MVHMTSLPCLCVQYLPQGQVACRQLEQRLVEDLKDVEPDHSTQALEDMLQRVRGNMGEDVLARMLPRELPSQLRV